MSAWDGAGYQGNPDKGYVSLVVPKGWKYKAFPVLSELSDSALISALNTNSHTARTYASYELVRRNAASATVLECIQDQSNSKHSRIAALYAYVQVEGVKSLSTLQELSKDAVIREHAIRAMADELTVAKAADAMFIAKFLTDDDPRVQAAAVIALGRIGNKQAASALISMAVSPVRSETIDKSSKAPIYKSKVLSDFKQEREIEVNIEKLTQLVLITDQVDQNKFDHAAWLNPTIILKDGKKIDLTKVKPDSISVDRGVFGVNQDCTGKLLKYKGKAAKGLGVHAQAEIVYSIPADAKMFTATGILTEGAKGQGNKKGKLLFAVSEHATKPTEEAGYIAPNVLNPHSTPNKDRVLPHLAQKALVALNAEDALVESIMLGEGEAYQGALATAKFMHSDKIVDALTRRAKLVQGPEKFAIVKVLARLHQKEKSYDGTTWWGTRPNPDGPYFTPVDWSGTSAINAFFSSEIANQGDKKDIIGVLKKNKAYVPELNPRPQKNNKKKVKKIGNTAIEDVVLFMNRYKGKAANGAKLITKVGCASCHNIDKEAVVKGPDLTKLGKMSITDLTEAIMKPGATIAPSWVNLTVKDGMVHTGTIVKEDQAEITLHNIAGMPTTLNMSDVEKREPGLNMMSLHLTDELTLPEFGDLLYYIKSLDTRN
ncbi:NPCBM/NEW2 domain-containing protein [Rubritalea sp.]|uniref:NPCBM/NEW2 domain-containing protein n=1 Tax=Rubritalea sp. TaxID=2109375 RepID=UPI003EF9D9AB